MKGKVKVMGKFEKPLARPKKRKVCKNCGRPVRDTVGDSGYCRKCIKEAKNA